MVQSYTDCGEGAVRLVRAFDCTDAVEPELFSQALDFVVSGDGINRRLKRCNEPRLIVGADFNMPHGSYPNELDCSPATKHDP